MLGAVLCKLALRWKAEQAWTDTLCECTMQFTPFV